MSNRKMSGSSGASGAIVAAVAATVPAIPFTQLSWPEVNKHGMPLKGSMMNALKALDAMKITCTYDSFHSRCIINGVDLKQYQGELSDKVTRVLRELSFKLFRFEPGKDAMYDAVLRACERHWVDPLVEYLDSLEGRWDGTKRLDKWLTTYFGADDTPLHAAWGRLTLLAAVARAYNHGIKYDHVLVLESPEGDGKSTAIRILAGGRDYFSDSTILGKTEKEQMELTQGVWFYEIGELAGMTKDEGRAVKAFVVRQEERSRPAYGRFKELQPRIPIFIGTFNCTSDRQTIEYLNVGDRRRWFPQPIKFVDLIKLANDRDQLLAEALHEWKRIAGAKVVNIEDRTEHPLLRLAPEFWAAAAIVQKSREKTDPFTTKLERLQPMLTTRFTDPDRIEAIYQTKRGYPALKDDDGLIYAIQEPEGGLWVSSAYVAGHLGVNINDGSRTVQAMRNAGWRGPKKDRRSGENVNGYTWERPEDPDPLS
jgi:hypothetical protein